MEYDQEKDEASCFACKNFLRGSNFRFSIREDLRRLKKQKSISHEQKTKEIDENRTYLKTIMESLTFVANQNIAMRSNNDDCTDIGSSSDTNRGNFLELLNIRCQSISKDASSHLCKRFSLLVGRSFCHVFMKFNGN